MVLFYYHFFPPCFYYIRNQETTNKLAKDVDVIINFAAETHVDRSISNPKPFIETNVLGTYSLLEAARKNDKLFIHVSTDEIYGDAEDKESFTEDDLLKPSNPYSATKAAALQDSGVPDGIRVLPPRRRLSNCVLVDSASP